MAQLCFDNAVAQVIHKYANWLLILLFGIAGWWISGIDARVTIIAQEQARRASRIEEVKQIGSDLIALRVQFGGLEAINNTLKSHEAMLRRIENRLDKVINEKNNSFKGPL
mgnify:CR=1 FL=1